MKTFFTIDYYVQSATIIIFILFASVYSVIKDISIWFAYYFVIGGFQLISFLIRIYLSYPKKFFFHLYGGLILPVWLGLLCSWLDLDSGVIISALVFSALFYAPILSAFYLNYCHNTYRNEKSIL